MFKVEYIKQDNIYKATFSGKHFSAYLEELRYSPFTFDGENKSWNTDNPKAVIDIVEKINEYEKVSISEEDSNRVFEAYAESIKPELVRYRVPKIDIEKDLKLPPKIGKPPYENFQLEEIIKGLSKNRHAWYCPMGSGKSFIFINVASFLKRWGRADKFLILVPTNGLVNCRREILRFSDEFDPERIQIATKDNRDVFRDDVDVVICAYHTFRRICDDYYLKTNKTLKDYRKSTIDFENWGKTRALFCDESHALKNNSAKRTKAVSLHAGYFHFRYLLTGTPTPKNFLDVYPQFKILDRSMIPTSYQDFMKEVADIGNRFSRWAVNYIYEDKQKKYENMYREYVSRYRIEDILDLPDLIFKRDYYLLSKKQEEIYQLLIEEEIQKLKMDNQGRLIPQKMMQKFPFLSLALDNPKLLSEHTFTNKKLNDLISRFNFEKDHAKVEALKEQVEDYISQGKKVTIFDYHPTTIESLAEVFKKYKPISFHGQTKIPKGMDAKDYRESLLDEFRFSTTRNLFIGSQKLLTEAINLQQCSRIFYFSRTYNFTEWSQSPKRFHRIGQEDRVIVHIMMFENTLDVRLDKNLNEKQELDSTIFQKDSLSLDEWKKIFKGEK